MSTSLIDGLNNIIREESGHGLQGHLCFRAVQFLRERGAVTDDATARAVDNFIYEARFVRSTPVGDDYLAELIVAEFNLED